MSETSNDKIISKRVFKSLVQLDESVKKKNASNSGELGERIRNQVENGNLHAGAFRIICMLNRKEESKRNDIRRALELYLDMADEVLWDGDTHTGDMVDEAESEEQKDAAAAAENERKLKAGIKPLSDEEAFQAEDGKPAESTEEPGSTQRRRGTGRSSTPITH